MIPAHKLKQLRKQVKGDHKRIADIADVTVETVSRVLNGVWMNKTVIEAAITVRDEKQAEMDALAAKI
jgi:DNA-binding LacI/PurR family transcriptional regulator